MIKNHFYRWADRWAVRLADRMGVTLARAKPLDLRGCDIHPIEAWYRAGRYQPVLMDVPLSKLRGLGSAAFPCTQDSGHPFIETLMDYESGKVRTYAGSALERFYQNWQPKNAAEYLGVDDIPRCEKLRELQATEGVFPWSRNDPKSYGETVNHVIRKASSSPYGKIKQTQNRWHLFGPATSESSEHEHRRLIGAYTSIKNKGYQRNSTNDGDIRGTLMLSNNDWCILIGGGGQHRSSVLSVLGLITVPVRLFYNLPMIVRREDSSYWPHVVDGLFTKEAAINIFDRIFEGRQPWQERQTENHG
ncbi:hypothetical protein [Thiorhodospira sibirica]|uniref:hypothetical protein n=1 Tax=Thiorhodospira sibirica TaxID=154347 RepID=UPI00022C1733|nr:hypothetical protein [Thiorhodospira sibirica]